MVFQQVVFDKAKVLIGDKFVQVMVIWSWLETVGSLLVFQAMVIGFLILRQQVLEVCFWYFENWLSICF